MKNEKKYVIGLDVGTTSVGWAVINPENYKVMKKNGKALWGVSLFDEATTAEKTRTFRSTRRRYDRRRKRIEFLQEEFKEEINKIDPLFYTKLKESFYNESDEINKTIKITKEEKEARKKYQKKYKTIYHLRKELLESNNKFDIRLVYLALHHMIKYRGNFLYTGNFNISNVNIPEKLNEIFTSYNNLVGNVIVNETKLNDLDNNQIDEIFNIEYKKDKEAKMKSLFTNIFDKKVAGDLAKALSGYKFNVYTLFNIDNDEKMTISFNGTDYEDNIDKLETELGESIETLSLIKDLYDMLFLKDLFKGEDSISISKLMVNRYNKHESDLKELKEILRNNRDEYNKIFRTKKDKLCFYDKYINNAITYDEFSKEILKLINKEDYNDIVKELENGNYLPRITSVENGKFPFQLNKYEMEQIIENQSKYYPFLNNKINDKPKIIKLLEFRIPYYVGPLNNTTNDKDIKNKNAWLVKKCNESITPYNLEEVVDLDETAKIFIERMLSNCSYLLKEKAMPSNSLTYSYYKVLNELKQISVNEIRLNKEFINYTIENLFKKTSGNITNKQFENFLRSTQEFANIEIFDIKGYSDNMKFANNLQSYYDFYNEETGFLKDTPYTSKEKEEAAENIINYITIFEDKDILERKLRLEYPELSDKVIKQIKNKKYKGWSRLSKKLLVTKYYKDPTDNVYKSIMDLMYETNDNFMQILFKEEYGFQKFIQEENEIKNLKKLDYNVVADLATSPANKKGIYQTLKVINEIVEYIGHDPETIVLEMAKGAGVKQRTENKKNYLIKLYEKNKENIVDYNNLMKELKSYEKIDDQKLFLYFIQEGKSLYSQERLYIDDFKDYEIDHIIPQTLIKDDSIENLALVKRQENQNKRDSFTLPAMYRNKNILWWKSLKDKNLISSKKMYNLMRTKYSKDDIKGFINRQLVETRQITKHVSNIINGFYENTNVFYINANLSSNYRNKFKIPKFRELNDYHHAHDAYLAAVLGEYKKNHFKNEVDISKLNELTKLFIKNQEFYKIKYGYIINSLDNEIYIDDETGEVIEIKKDTHKSGFDNEKFNETIKYNLYRNDILVARKTEIRTGQFYNEKIYGKNHSNTKNGISLKDNWNKDLYGSYSSMAPSYMALVKYGNKVKLIGIPLIVDVKATENKEKFIREHLNVKENVSVEILKDKIPFNTLIDLNGHLCRITGYGNVMKTNEVVNAYEFKISKDLYIKWQKTLLKLFKGYKDETYTNYENDINELYGYIIEFIKINHPLYNNLLSKINENIDFKNLEEENKFIMVRELIAMLKCNGTFANLSNINSKFNNFVGRMNGKNITSGTIIFQSPTGLRETRYIIEDNN